MPGVELVIHLSTWHAGVAKLPHRFTDLIVNSEPRVISSEQYILIIQLCKTAIPETYGLS